VKVSEARSDPGRERVEKEDGKELEKSEKIAEGNAVT